VPKHISFKLEGSYDANYVKDCIDKKKKEQL